LSTIAEAGAPAASPCEVVALLGDLVVVRGGGDLGSGVALRLWRSGFHVVILESPSPMAVRRSVAFSEAVYEGRSTVEEVTADLLPASARAVMSHGRRSIPVIVDPHAELVADLAPAALVDAIMAKRNTGTRRAMATAVVALGPGFAAPEEVTAVVETDRGPHLGRVIWEGKAAPNTGTPGLVGGASADRVVRAPADGAFAARVAIGDRAQQGDLIGIVSGVESRARIAGVVRGVLREGTQVRVGMKVGDIDPRLDRSLCFQVSDKSLAVAGGVLEAVMSLLYGSRAAGGTLD
jgi:xanthine dehydrogenase accessory factor